MSAKTRFFICNMRFDTMVDEKGEKDPFPWAHIHILEESKVTENFAGSSVGKMPVVRDNNNQIAKRLHAQYAEHFPGYFDVEVTLTVKAGAMVAAVTNLTPVLE